MLNPLNASQNKIVNTIKKENDNQTADDKISLEIYFWEEIK